MKLIKPFKYKGVWYLNYKIRVIGRPYEWDIHFTINRGLKMSSIDLRSVNQTRS